MEIIADLTLLAIQAALSSAEILRKGFHTSFKIDKKEGIHNLVTEYDLLSEKNIIDVIKTHYPSHCFLSEETGLIEGEKQDVQWIIDPLDGTVNFAHGIPVFGINIAAKMGHQIVLGVTYQPMTNELFVAQKNKGAVLNGQPIHVSETKTIEDSIVGTGFPYNLQENPNRCIERFFSIAKLGIPIRRLGAACVDFAYLACGRIDGFWETNLGPWDCAAGQIILEEAGGKMTDWNGQPFAIEKHNKVVATNGHIHEQIINLFENV